MNRQFLLGVVQCTPAYKPSAAARRLCLGLRTTQSFWGNLHFGEHPEGHFHYRGVLPFDAHGDRIGCHDLFDFRASDSRVPRF